MSTPGIGELLHQAMQQLPAEDANPRLDAEVLLACILRKPRSFLYSHPEHIPSRTQLARFQALLDRRLRGEPVAYLTGKREFWGMDLKVNADTLIPRPETEHLVEAALELLPATQPVTVADLGTGSGAIALAIRRERPRSTLLAVDRSPDALRVARINSKRLRIPIRCLMADWCNGFAAQSLDMIVSNPPYVAAGDAVLKSGDLRFEPKSALSAGKDGLAAIRRLVPAAAQTLKPGAWLLLEHGYNQGEAVRELLRNAGFVNISSRQDYRRLERITLGRLPT
jgi:release factor glutamine methyltransferase